MAFEISVFLENKITHFEAITALLKKGGNQHPNAYFKQYGTRMGRIKFAGRPA